MDRNGRLQGNQGDDAGPAAAAPAATDPQTPKKSHADLNTIVRSFEAEWKLGLKERPDGQSPSQWSDTKSGRVYGHFKRLYWAREPVLEQALDSFRKEAPRYQHAKRLDLLRETLIGQVQSPVSKAEPLPNSQGSSTAALQSSGHVSNYGNPFNAYRQGASSSYDATATEPGTPTDVEEDDLVTPPSPTLYSRSAQRRVQASLRFHSTSSTRKRPFSSSYDSGVSPRLTKIPNWKQASNTQSESSPIRPPPQPLFKKPSPDMAPSYQPTSMNSSNNTSFNTMWSSQRTRPYTATSSFTSDAQYPDVKYPALRRASSSTIESMSDADLLNVIVKLEKERNRRSQKMERANSGPSLSPRTPSALQSPQGQNVVESPSRLPYYIRDIPDQNLFVDELATELCTFSYFILFVCRRLASENRISMRELMRGMNASQVRSSSLNFWKIVNEHPSVSHSAHRDPQNVWPSARRGFDGYTFKGRVVFNKSGPVFSLELLPIQPERSCRFQRKFGSDRFLYLNFPPFEGTKSKPPRFTLAEMELIQEKWKEWFHKEHSFLGRKWRAFHIEPIRKKASQSKDDNSDKRIVLFATEGIGIDKPMSVGQILNWFFPFARNMDEKFCKAYARLDLGLSRTIPTIIFKPYQLQLVKDILADGTPEDTRFNDPRLDWKKTYAKKTVMNDGCSLMSVGAAIEIWKLYSEATDTQDPLPSAFQGRIGGAKGMWMICGEPSSTKPEELEIWIQITESQLKFNFQDEDLCGAYDPHRLTFDYVKHSYSPSSSELHISFIPIIVDRGVSWNVIARLMMDRLDQERDELLGILSDPVKLHRWVHQQSPASDPENPRWQAAMHHSLPEKIQHLIRSGFYPEDEPYLASILCRFIRQQQMWMEQKLKVPLGKAIFAFGVADPTETLAPGEVHFSFSTPFREQLTGRTYRTLNNEEVLVARQPACRRSDIQKARAVWRPELAHLVDVVVFPSRGEFPLAGKLQGGDYDGDIFWLCWEPDLVEPFKNAPAPLEAPVPSKYNIQQDTRKLQEVMNPTDLSTVDNLMREALEFRMASSKLGMVTNFLERQAYLENQISSDALNGLCDMHDLLVDAPKQGYLLSHNGYNETLHKKLCCGNPDIPAYKQAMNDCEAKKELGEADKMREKDYKHNKDNVLDYLYFDVVRKHDVATLKMIRDAFPKEVSDDPALQYPYLQLQDNDSDAIKTELALLLENLKAVVRKWRDTTSSRDNLTSDQYNRAVDTCYKMFRSIMPNQVNHPDIKPWLHPYSHADFSIWDTIRASALYTEYPKRHALVWHMAGRELAKLKCDPIPGAILVNPGIFANMKPKTIKVPKPEEYEEEWEEESEDEFQNALDFIPV